MTEDELNVAAAAAANAVGVTPHSDMRLFVEQAVKYALQNTPITKDGALEALNTLCEYFHQQSKKNGWWLERKELPSGHVEIIDHTQWEDPFFIATKLALIHSEASEGLEGFRKDLPDDKLTHYPGLAVELADGIIRNCDLAGRFGYRLGDICKEKDAYNDVRKDHKIEDRSGKFGKKF